MSLKKTIQGHAAALLERDSAKALLSDALCNDIPRVNALMGAYDSGIVRTIRKSYPLGSMERGSAIGLVSRQYSMREDTAEWAVDTWIDLIDAEVVRELNDAENERKAAQFEAILLDEGFGVFDDWEDDSALSGSGAESVDYYINVSLKKVPGRIFVPCGVGNTDNGFFICGISEGDFSTAPAAYALTYNYLIRNTRIMPEDYPRYLRDVETPRRLNYQRIFRLMIIILQLVKNGYVTKSLNLAYSGKPEELEIATAIVNDYVELFSNLMHVEPDPLVLMKPTASALKVSLDGRVEGVYIEENKIPCNARELWLSDKINYRLDEESLPYLERILGEISPFDTFKEGQFAALRDMLSADGHSMCIMPTGSGKSLIFYLASLLQPLPLFVLVPTEILIEDQIRNLKKIHRMDNVSHLMLTSENDFGDFEMRNSLMYLTPETFQSRNLLAKCRDANNGQRSVSGRGGLRTKKTIAPGPAIAYVVLDEIHCLSNWGHDFRPEYLLLSQFLDRYLDRVSFLGFTATANFAVVEDVQMQLRIPQESIFSPVEFEKYNVSYHFQACDSFEGMVSAAKTVVSGCIARNERTLVFTKSEEISCAVAQAIGYEADVFLKGNTSTYHLFADEKCKVLVASGELGIGINLPNVRNIVHFGLPVSKNEFVQEIGRAGRANEQVNSYVIYLEPTAQNAPEPLLKRESGISGIAHLLSLGNDYSDCYQKLSNGMVSKDELSRRVVEEYEELESRGQASYVKKYSLESLDATKRILYILHIMGYIHEWYFCANDARNGVARIIINVRVSNTEFYRNPANMLNRMKKRAVEYYESLGSNREQIVKTQRVGDASEVLGIYVDWYYAEYLYHHKEMFLDFFDFVESNFDNDCEKITEDIRDYFTLPFVEIKSDETYYSRLSLGEIAERVAQGIGRNKLANIERINSKRYSLNLDCMLFLGNLKVSSRFDERRLERILAGLTEPAHREFAEAVRTVFARLSTSARLAAILGFVECGRPFGSDVGRICSLLYEGADRDVVYYGVVAERLNGKFHH